MTEKNRTDKTELPDKTEIDADRLLKQRLAVIRVAHSISERGLIVRTWGSVSRRSDRDHFIITPSGVYFNDLTPDRIIRVNLKKLSYKGKLKPSSEMAIHAAIYQVRGEDAGFIIHTHQPYASCASVLGEAEIYLPHDKMDNADAIVRVPVVPYAEPGTKVIAEQVSDVISRNPYCQGLLLENHGVVCWGRNERQARARAESIEILCYTYLSELGRTNLQYGIQEHFSSERDGEDIRYLDELTPERIRAMHRRIYAARPDVNCIIQIDSEAERIVSRRFVELETLFDDFAQIVGPETVRIPGNEREALADTILIRKRMNVVFSPDDGAFCLGADRTEAEACALIVNKECIAQVAVTRYGKGHALSRRQCAKSHKKYRDYSVLAAKYALRGEAE